ncbi:Ammonium transporter Rh type A [Bienertia sinuspersici]
MAKEQKAEGTEETNGSDPTVGFAGKIEAKYHELKKHAEAYPYVWASYMVVYGGFGLWFAYRWRKLRKTEDRVRALQERLRQLAQAEESASKSSSTPSNEGKPPK